jgi:hypothetical protein
MVTASTTALESHHSGHDQVICTLYEGDFQLGVAALINSIVRGGFRGLFWIGNRGDLPPWTTQLTCREDGLFQIGDALLGFETIDSQRHFGQFKPEFMSSIVDRGIARMHLWYFDPDITVRCEWSFFERWVRHGVCICQDMTTSSMASNHPLRCEWVELASNAGWDVPFRQQERYYNSGFVGLDIEYRAYLDTWKAAVRLANASGVKHDQFQKGRPGHHEHRRHVRSGAADHARPRRHGLGNRRLHHAPRAWAQKAMAEKIHSLRSRRRSSGQRRQALHPLRRWAHSPLHPRKVEENVLVYSDCHADRPVLPPQFLNPMA